jgi:hypothetical protein
VSYEDRRKTFAKNFECLCRYKSGGTWFLAEELTGIKRLRSEDAKKKEDIEEVRELTSVRKRLERWCYYGVVRFDRRTRQDLARLKGIFNLRSVEDFWREGLCEELEKTIREEEEEQKKKSWIEEMHTHPDLKRFYDDADIWSHKVWQIFFWYGEQQMEGVVMELAKLLDDVWEQIPVEWREEHYKW